MRLEVWLGRQQPAGEKEQVNDFFHFKGRGTESRDLIWCIFLHPTPMLHQQRDICTHVHPPQPQSDACYWRQRQIFMTPPLSLQRQTVVDVKLCTSGDVFHKSLIRTKQQLLLACSGFWEWSQDETVKFCEAGWRLYRHANGVAMSGNEVKTLRAGPNAANVSGLVAMLAAD